MKAKQNTANVVRKKSEFPFLGTSAGPGSAPSESPPACVTAALAEGEMATVEVTLDSGFGNSVFLRGSGGGLTWERGILLDCIDGKTWRWSGMIKDPITVRALLNDCLGSAGSDVLIQPGQKVEIKPSFGDSPIG